MYNGIRNSKRKKPKEEIIVDTENGITTNKEKLIKIVTNWFQKAENQSNFLEIPSKEMKHPFTGEEVNKAIQSLKNKESAGIDNITAEQLKYDPKEINEGIAELLNSTAKTGKHPKEIKQ